MTQAPAFGDILRRLRASAGLTQEELAEKAGLSVEAISALERGTRHAPRRETVQLLTEALHLTPEQHAELVAARRRGSAEPAALATSPGAASPVPGPATSLPRGRYLGAAPDGPMVAREAELTRLAEVTRLVADRRGQMVIVSGETGIGKTRLGQELTEHARAVGFTVATGRCYELHQSFPFSPFLEALATAFAQAPTALREEAPSHWPDLMRLLPERASDLPSPPPISPVSGQEDQLRLFWAVTGFLRALADDRPVALLLDDLHWADASSIALLAHIARQTRACRILLGGAYRDVDLSREHPLAMTLRNLGQEGVVERITLHPLSHLETQALLEARLRATALPAGLAERVFRASEGNPLFAHEMISALIERGDLTQRDGGWTLRTTQSEVLPESVRAIIEDRLKLLSPTTQEVLQEASVLGVTFSFAELQALRDRTEVEVEGALDAAQTAGLARDLGKDRYAFAHGVMQQTLYATLSPRRRQRAHRLAGEMLERAASRDADALAWHFIQGDVAERALPYALAAGDRAESVYAHAEAEQHYQVALDLARDLGEHSREAEALEKLGALRMTVARYADALDALEHAEAVYRASGDLEGRRRALAQMGRVHARRGTPEPGISRLVALLQVADEPTRGLAMAHIALSDLYYVSGRYREQVGEAERAGEMARALGDETLLAQAEQWRSTALLALGRAEEALPVLREVIPVAESSGDLSSHTHALTNIALAYIQRGEFETGRSYIARALEVAERRGDPAHIAFMTYNRGMIAVYMGEWTQAQADFDRAAAMMARVGMSWMAAYPLLGLGHLALIQGQWEAGAQAMGEAITLAEGSGDLQALRFAQIPLIERDLLEGRPEVARARLDRLLDPRGSGRFEGVAQLLSLMAWTHLELDEEPQAEALAAQGVERARAEGNQLILVDALRVRAMVAARHQRWKDAHSQAEEALTLSQTMPCPYHTARALFTAGMVDVEHGRLDAARERLAAAQAMLVSLGERLYAQRIEPVMAELSH